MEPVIGRLAPYEFDQAVFGQLLSSSSIQTTTPAYNSILPVVIDSKELDNHVLTNDRKTFVNEDFKANFNNSCGNEDDCVIISSNLPSLPLEQKPKSSSRGADWSTCTWQGTQELKAGSSPSAAGNSHQTSGSNRPVCEQNVRYPDLIKDVKQSLYSSGDRTYEADSEAKRSLVQTMAANTSSPVLTAVKQHAEMLTETLPAFCLVKRLENLKQSQELADLGQLQPSSDIKLSDMVLLAPETNLPPDYHLKIVHAMSIQNDLARTDNFLKLAELELQEASRDFQLSGMTVISHLQGPMTCPSSGWDSNNAGWMLVKKEQVGTDQFMQLVKPVQGVTTQSIQPKLIKSVPTVFHSEILNVIKPTTPTSPAERHCFVRPKPPSSHGEMYSALKSRTPVVYLQQLPSFCSSQPVVLKLPETVQELQSAGSEPNIQLSKGISSQEVINTAGSDCDKKIIDWTVIKDELITTHDNEQLIKPEIDSCTTVNQQSPDLDTALDQQSFDMNTALHRQSPDMEADLHQPSPDIESDLHRQSSALDTALHQHQADLNAALQPSLPIVCLRQLPGFCLTNEPINLRLPEVVAELDISPTGTACPLRLTAVNPDNSELTATMQRIPKKVNSMVVKNTLVKEGDCLHLANLELDSSPKKNKATLSKMVVAVKPRKPAVCLRRPPAAACYRPDSDTNTDYSDSESNSTSATPIKVSRLTRLRRRLSRNGQINADKDQLHRSQGSQSRGHEHDKITASCGSAVTGDDNRADLSCDEAGPAVHPSPSPVSSSDEGGSSCDHDVGGEQDGGDDDDSYVMESDDGSADEDESSSNDDYEESFIDDNDGSYDDDDATYIGDDDDDDNENDDGNSDDDDDDEDDNDKDDESKNDNDEGDEDEDQLVSEDTEESSREAELNNEERIISSSETVLAVDPGSTTTNRSEATMVSQECTTTDGSHSEILSVSESTPTKRYEAKSVSVEESMSTNIIEAKLASVSESSLVNINEAKVVSVTESAASHNRYPAISLVGSNPTSAVNIAFGDKFSSNLEVKGTTTKRLFIGGLAPSVTPEEILMRFSQFGSVQNLILTHRTDPEGRNLKKFAHLDIQGSTDQVKKIFSSYQNALWKGSRLDIQYAKEHILQKLQRERQEAELLKNSPRSSPAKSVPNKLTSEVKKGQSKPVSEVFQVNGPAVPGALVPGKKNWVVGKYGRVLPILRLKKSYKCKMIKVDPSKYCHAAKVFREDDGLELLLQTPCSRLTWEITDPDSEVTKKRKGQFPVIKPAKKPRQFMSALEVLASRDAECHDIEIVQSGFPKQHQSHKTAGSSRFDSDNEDSPSQEGASKNHLASKFANNVDYSSANIVMNRQRHSVEAVPQESSRIGLNSKHKAGSGCQGTNPASLQDGGIQDTLKREHTSSSPGLKQTSPVISSQDRGAEPCHKVCASMSQSVQLKKSMSSVKKEEPAPLDSLGRIQEFQGLAMLGIVADYQSSLPQAATHFHSELQASPKTDTRFAEKTVSRTQSKNTSLQHSPAKKRKIKDIESSETANIDSKSASKKKKVKSVKSKKDVVVNKDEVPIPAVLVTTKKKSKLKQANKVKDSKGYDSASSTGTDEIIAKCRKRMGMAESSITSTQDRLSSLANLDEGKKRQAVNHLDSEQSKLPQLRDEDTSDSNLDSSDLKLVALTLAKKAASSGSPMPAEKALQKVCPNLNKTGSPGLSSSSPQSDQTHLQKKSPGLSKQAADNEKRLQAMQENWKQKQQQKSINHAALKNVDTGNAKPGQRIVFSDNEASDSEQKPVKSKSKKELFDSSDENEDYDSMFASKPHLEGKKGEKLMKLEHKIGDPRFKLHAKFAESDSEDESSIQRPGVAQGAEDEAGLSEEKNTYLKILQDVVGKAKLDAFSEKLKRNTKLMIDMNAVRFDPTRQVNTEATSDTKRKPLKKANSEKSGQRKDIVQNEMTTLVITEKKKKEKSEKPQKESKKQETGLDETSSPKTNKKKEKLKSKVTQDGTDQMTASNDPVSAVNQNKVRVASSLLDMFKANQASESFSLLQHFDTGSAQVEYQGKADLARTTAPLSALPVSTRQHLQEETSEETNSKLQIKTVQKAPDKVMAVVDSSSDSDDSDDDSRQQHLTETSDEKNEDKDLISAGRVDIRYSKEEWLVKWQEMRPVIRKLYSSKRKQARKGKWKETAQANRQKQDKKPRWKNMKKQ